MIFRDLLFLSILSILRATRPSQRGDFAPVPTVDYASHLIEGDIALPPHPLGSEAALNSFLKAKKSLWPRGRVHYRIEEDEWNGIMEPVFLDSQIANITLALRKIEAGVPCINFK